MKRLLIGAAVATGMVTTALAGTASAHLHPFNPAASCAPEETGAGNESTAFFTAPGVLEHWDTTDISPMPGSQIIVQYANPGKAQESSGAIGGVGAFTGNPGHDVAVEHCS